MDREIPITLWRLMRLALIAVLVSGVAGVILLANGAADPPKAGPLVWASGPLPGITLPARSTFTSDQPIERLTPPYTLEVTGRLSMDSDLAAEWGIQFDSSPFGIFLEGYGLFAVLPGDFTPFIHIPILGELDKLTLDVQADQQATLRINDEIAWRGTVPAAHTARIAARGGVTGSARLTVEQTALFAPR